jgi:hypothetical protein
LVTNSGALPATAIVSRQRDLDDEGRLLWIPTRTPKPRRGFPGAPLPGFVRAELEGYSDWHLQRHPQASEGGPGDRQGLTGHVTEQRREHYCT